MTYYLVYYNYLDIYKIIKVYTTDEQSFNAVKKMRLNKDYKNINVMPKNALGLFNFLENESSQGFTILF